MPSELFPITHLPEDRGAVLSVCCERLETPQFIDFQTACLELLETNQHNLFIDACRMATVNSLFIGVVVKTTMQRVILCAGRTVAQNVHKLMGDLVETCDSPGEIPATADSL